MLIDDVQRTSSGAPFARASDGVARFANVGVGTELFASMLPDELERIEVMQSGSGRPVYMLRIYTRQFIARMTGGGVQLAKPFMAEAGLCR